MILNYENKIELCQLKDNGSSQMMGYIITTKNKKTIVIDGGTDKDTQNLIEQIKQRTGKVDYWFITHPHKDHATCFINIVQNTDIKIENVYVTLNEIDWYKQYEPQRTIEAENLQKVLQNEKIIRNKLKIKASVNNAKIFKGIQKEYGTFYNYLSNFTENKIIYEPDKTTNQLSDNLSKDLQKRGMKFVGSTIIYSYLQAIGVIYSHDKECFMYRDNKFKLTDHNNNF